MTAPVISVRGLTKSFGSRLAVDHLDLDVAGGSITGFLGPNGSGKTTTIRMVSGLVRPDAGSGTCLGFDVIRESLKIKARIGYMTQRFSLYEDLSIEENLSFIARLHGLDAVGARVRRALDELGLANRARQLSGTLSGGWKQRLALAAATIHAPEILLLDEPTAGVDPKARRDFWNQIRSFADQGVTTLVSTHYMDEAVQCDRIAFIAGGKKLIDAPTREIPVRVGLKAWRITGERLGPLAEQLERDARVGFVARFGMELRACGRDAESLAEAVLAATNGTGYEAEPVEAGLEEAFIHLMGAARPAS